MNAFALPDCVISVRPEVCVGEGGRMTAGGVLRSRENLRPYGIKHNIHYANKTTGRDCLAIEDTQLSRRETLENQVGEELVALGLRYSQYDGAYLTVWELRRGWNVLVSYETLLGGVTNAVAGL